MIDIGFIIALIASVIALFGVYQFNQQQDYTGARVTWFYSNSLFVVLFAGRTIGVLDGGFTDALMAIYFAVMWWSNMKGLMQ